MITSTDTIQLSRKDIESLPNYKQKTRQGEYSSSCIRCGGVDRFLFWPDKGNYLCRRCDLKGFVIDSNSLSFTEEQYAAWKRAETERKAKERQQQAQIIKQLNRVSKADYYHVQMVDRSYWYSQGLNNETIDHFKLGYTSACPTCPTSPSWTIPIFYQGQLYNIRHRLTNPDNGGKYRPEMAGLPAAMFNADVLAEDDWMIVIVEGEVKAMVLQQYGFSAVGIPGASSFKERWVKLFNSGAVVYVALDPGAEAQADEIGTMLKAGGVEVRICRLPAKPDDMIVKYGASAYDLCEFLKLGKRYET